MEMTEPTTRTRGLGGEGEGEGDPDDKSGALKERIEESLQCSSGSERSSGDRGVAKDPSNSTTSRGDRSSRRFGSLAPSPTREEEEEDDDAASVPPVVPDDDQNDEDIMADPRRTLNPTKAATRKQLSGRRTAAADWAGMAGNVLEWYDFAVFGYLSDVLGHVFFPVAAVTAVTAAASVAAASGDDTAGNSHRLLAIPSNVTTADPYDVTDPTDFTSTTTNNNNNTLYAFAVFGGAFWMRPIGGLMLGYWGDKYGSRSALAMSIFLMAIPTFALGCLPTFSQVGYLSTALLVLVRMVQGLSVGGQLVTSIVFALEGHPPEVWGFRGSCVMATANVGSLLGSLVGYVLRSSLSYEELVRWGWRLPFLSGIVVSVAGFYLRSLDEGSGNVATSYDELSSAADSPEHHDAPTPDDSEAECDESEPPTNPICVSLRSSNLRPLLAASLVPMLWSGAFYLTFVWMAIFMSSLSESPVPYAFGVNTISMFLSLCVFFPLAGIASDRIGRRAVMTLGGCSCALLGPLAVRSISSGTVMGALAGQLSLGVAVSCWGAPMCAWIVEAFPDPKSRLTSANMGYNLAQAVAGGSAPALATLVASRWGPSAPGYLYSVLAALSLSGLWLAAPDLSASSRSRHTGSTWNSEARESSSPPRGRPSFRPGDARGGFSEIPTTEMTTTGAARP